jgi:hypothetical protein
MSVQHTPYSSGGYRPSLVVHDDVSVSFSSPAGYGANGQPIPGVVLHVSRVEKKFKLTALPGDRLTFVSKDEACGFALDCGYLLPYYHPRPRR